MIAANIHKKLRSGYGQTDLRVKLMAFSGSITVIHGPSGAGKSTFLKVLAGLMVPNEGKIAVNNRIWLDTAKNITLSTQKRRVGFVFQNYALFPNMTIREHLEYACNDKDWIDRLLKIGALDGLSDRKPEYLSGGQQQRLAILRAMSIKPAVMLMDEPFSALDQKTKAGLIADLKAVWDEMKTTVVIVSHNPQELDGIATQELYICAE
jgi:molybdate transport system ATP-binding protein